MGEHPISKELRYMRICFICLIFVLIFFDGEKEVPVSTTHDVPLNNMPTSNMTQIAENTFVLQENDPETGDRHTIKISKYAPDANKVILVKEINTENTSTYEYQLNPFE